MKSAFRWLMEKRWWMTFEGLVDLQVEGQAGDLLTTPSLQTWCLSEDALGRGKDTLSLGSSNNNGSLDTHTWLVRTCISKRDQIETTHTHTHTLRGEMSNWEMRQVTEAEVRAQRSSEHKRSMEHDLVYAMHVGIAPKNHPYSSWECKSNHWCYYSMILDVMLEGQNTNSQERHSKLAQDKFRYEYAQSNVACLVGLTRSQDRASALERWQLELYFQSQRDWFISSSLSICTPSFPRILDSRQEKQRSV